MDLRQLEYFLYVAQCRSFTRAAKHFFIGQPAISRKIAALEEEVGTKLFIRDNRSVKLTAAGEVLQKEGSFLLEHASRTLEKARKAGEGAIGSISIAALGDFGGLLPEIVRCFSAVCPEIAVNIERLDFTQLYEQVFQGWFDLGVTLSYSVPDMDGLDCTVLGKESFCVLAVRGSPVLESGPVVREALMREKVILPPYVSPPFFSKIFNGPPEQSSQRVSFAPSMDSLLLQVGSGLGVSIVPSFVLASLPLKSNIESRPLADVDAVADGILIWRRDNTNPAVKSFVGLCRTGI
jgi:DNA-binding transcriptional LysR family regulator